MSYRTSSSRHSPPTTVPDARPAAKPTDPGRTRPIASPLCGSDCVPAAASRDASSAGLFAPLPPKGFKRYRGSDAASAAATRSGSNSFARTVTASSWLFCSDASQSHSRTRPRTPPAARTISARREKVCGPSSVRSASTSTSVPNGLCGFAPLTSAPLRAGGSNCAGTRDRRTGVRHRH